MLSPKNHLPLAVIGVLAAISIVISSLLFKVEPMASENVNSLEGELIDDSVFEGSDSEEDSSAVPQGARAGEMLVMMGAAPGQAQDELIESMNTLIQEAKETKAAEKETEEAAQEEQTTEAEVVSSPLPEGYRIMIRPRADSEWIDRLFTLKGNISPVHRAIVPHMYAAIPKDEIAVTVLYGNETAGIGLGILDRGSVGIYAIHVNEAHRKKGIATAVISSILLEASSAHAQTAYLQVMEDNHPAICLYRKLGFSHSYRCYFRVREVL